MDGGILSYRARCIIREALSLPQTEEHTKRSCHLSDAVDNECIALEKSKSDIVGLGESSTDGPTWVKTVCFPVGLNIPPPILLGLILSRACFASLNDAGLGGGWDAVATSAFFASDFVGSEVRGVNGWGGVGDGRTDGFSGRVETGFKRSSDTGISSTIAIGTLRRTVFGSPGVGVRI